jgi:hypothetical protein
MKAAVLAGGLMLAAVSAQGALPDLKNMHEDDLMLNACKPVELRRLQREIAALAGSQAPGKAWRLVREMLCGTARQSSDYIVAHTSRRVASIDEATGNTEPAKLEYVPASQVLPARMRAWRASVGKDGSGVSVTFNADEGACIQSFSLHPRGGDWEIVAIEQGCD